MCQAAIEQKFGYQKQPSGVSRVYGAIEAKNVQLQHYRASRLNPYQTGAFTGDRPGITYAEEVPAFFGKQYSGIFPVKEQPKLEMPFPYQTGNLIG